MEENDAKSKSNEFKEKLKSIQFGIVKGGYRHSNSPSYVDNESLSLFPSKEEVMDYRSDYRRAPEKEIKLENQPVYEHKGR